VHQSASLLIPLFSGRLDVVSNLRFESFSEHPPGSGSGDLVEIEQESFVLDPNLMYPLDRCTPSRRRANVGSLFDCSKGRYTTLKRKSPIHNYENLNGGVPGRSDPNPQGLGHVPSERLVGRTGDVVTAPLRAGRDFIGDRAFGTSRPRRSCVRLIPALW
jgi:hypothetical protein